MFQVFDAEPGGCVGRQSLHKEMSSSSKGGALSALEKIRKQRRGEAKATEQYEVGGPLSFPWVDKGPQSVASAV